MRVLFLYPNHHWRSVSEGIASMSAVLKAGGHDTAFTFVEGFSPKRIIKLMERHSPGLVALSSVSNQIGPAKQVIAFISRRWSVPVVLGGVHATVAPFDVVRTPGLLATCIGEGEGALLDLADRLDESGPVDDIPNLWTLKDGQVARNGPRPLINDLDALPFPDYEVFDYQGILDEKGVLAVMSGRGCPFGCTFCVNHTLRGLYKGKGRLVRRKSVERVVEEIARLKARYMRVRSVEFFDDTFTLDRTWLEAFARLYPGKVGLPFRCNARADLMDREMAALLRGAGCTWVNMAVECGNERIRREILHKGVTDAQLTSAFRIAHETGLRTYAQNMVGLPGETEADILRTIELNRALGPEDLQCWIFYPYPGTEIRRLCEEQGFLSEREIPAVSAFGAVSPLDQPSITPRTVGYYHRVFKALVYHPDTLGSRILTRLARSQTASRLLEGAVLGAYRHAPSLLIRSVKGIFDQLRLEKGIF